MKKLKHYLVVNLLEKLHPFIEDSAEKYLNLRSIAQSSKVVIYFAILLLL